jgi:hypothetical protein
MHVLGAGNACRVCCHLLKCTVLGVFYMSLCLVQGRALMGLQAVQVTVEVHLANGLPSFTLVGLADVEVVSDN